MASITSVATTQLPSINRTQIMSTTAMMTNPLPSSSQILPTGRNQLNTIVEISIAQDFDPDFNDKTSAEYKRFTTALINEVTIFCELSMPVYR